MQIRAHATKDGLHVVAECSLHETHAHTDTIRRIGQGLLFDLGLSNTASDWSVWADGYMIHGSGAHSALRTNASGKEQLDTEVDWTFGGSVGGDPWPPANVPSPKLR